MFGFGRKKKREDLVNPDSTPETIAVDMRGPSRAVDCLDGLVAFPGAVERMRTPDNAFNFLDVMLAGTQVAFDRLQAEDRGSLLVVAASAQDLLYRHIMQLTMMDRHTLEYCAVVNRYFFDKLTELRLPTLYILDNTLREDRLRATLDLFEISGITTVTPSRDGAAWPPLAAKLRAHLGAFGHAAYIEPDAEVNHLDAARALATEIPCLATFRNLHPDDPEHQILNFTDANGAA